MLDEEEISDVSLATFYLFDKEDLGTSRPGVQLAAFRGGCGCGHGCGGGGCRGCGGGSRLRRWRLQRLRRWRLQRLWRWLSRLWLWRLWWLRRLRRRDLGLGRRLLLVVGRLRPLLD